MRLILGDPTANVPTKPFDNFPPDCSKGYKMRSDSIPLVVRAGVLVFMMRKNLNAAKPPEQSQGLSGNILLLLLFVNLDVTWAKIYV